MIDVSGDIISFEKQPAARIYPYLVPSVRADFIRFLEDVSEDKSLEFVREMEKRILDKLEDDCPGNELFSREEVRKAIKTANWEMNR